MDVSLTVFDIDTFSSKIACFFSPPLLDAPCGGTPCNINVIYTPLKSTFNGLRRRQCGSIFIRLAAVGSKNREIKRMSDKI